MKWALNNFLMRFKRIFYQRFGVDQVLNVYLLLWNKLNALSHLHKKNIRLPVSIEGSVVTLFLIVAKRLCIRFLE